ncbi:MAG: phosphodiester glycosidase family protein [Candidatus Muirbacterium halophilum]|nr:phosphodiester glycosidase family protein [Candidatus Muirbacterium halophilum]MCK9474780.1 phosphodiester glycosidase family protein [Candidatus Muirbacterium halophilum]
MNILKTILGKYSIFREDISINVDFSNKSTNINCDIKNGEISIDKNLRNRKYETSASFTSVSPSVKTIEIKSKKVIIKEKLTFFKKTLIFLLITIFSFQFSFAKVLYPGIEIEKKTFNDKEGPQVAYTVILKKGYNYIKRVVLSDFSLFHRNSLTYIAEKYNALIAINAAFYNVKTGRPLGTVIINHKIVCLPVYRRSVLCFTDNNDYFITVPDIKTEFMLKNKKFTIDSINQPYYMGKISLFTPEFGSSTKTEKNGIELSISSDKIVEISSKNAYIPPDGYVISVHDPDNMDFFSKAGIFDKVSIEFFPGEEMKNVRYAIGGGPTLIKDGKLHITAIEEKFKPDVVFYNAPRTAAGINKEGDLCLITLDGRQKGYSSGMKLKDFADFLYSEGYYQAMNLDGGGSSTLVIDGKLINRPSDGRQRNINGAIIIEYPE